MRLPARPTSIAELKERIDSGELRESRVLEFKRQFPKKNEDIARQVAGLAAQGGVLVIGVEEPEGSVPGVTPIATMGARERVEQIARDIPKPPVQVESHIVDDGAPGRGVLWIEIPASPEMLHQVGGAYYMREDTQTRPMSDSEVADRMKLRQDRCGPIERALDEALAREPPAAPSLHGRTCIVARPVGADPEEFHASTHERAAWESFASGFQPLWHFDDYVQNRYWGQFSNRREPPRHLSTYCDINLRYNGAYSHLSYSQDRFADNEGGIAPFLALRACGDAIALIVAIQQCTGQRRMWDLAFSITDVEGRTARSSNRSVDFAGGRTVIPRNHYRQVVLGVSTNNIEGDAGAVGRELTEHFVAECGLDFDVEWAEGAGVQRAQLRDPSGRGSPR